MTVLEAVAKLGLFVRAEHGATKVSGQATIGDVLTKKSWTDVAVGAAFKVSNASGAAEARWAVKTNVLSIVTGTPTFTDGDGNDFEGEDLPDQNTVYALKVVTPATNATAVEMQGAAWVPSVPILGPGTELLLAIDAGQAETPVATVDFVFTGQADVFVVVVGKS